MTYHPIIYILIFVSDIFLYINYSIIIRMVKIEREDIMASYYYISKYAHNY